MATRRFDCPRTQYDREIPRHIRELLHELKDMLCASVGRFVPPAYWPVAADAIANSEDTIEYGGAPSARVVIRGGSIAEPYARRIPWTRRFERLVVCANFERAGGESSGNAGIPSDLDTVVRWSLDMRRRLRRRFWPLESHIVLHASAVFRNYSSVQGVELILWRLPYPRKSAGRAN